MNHGLGQAETHGYSSGKTGKSGYTPPLLVRNFRRIAPNGFGDPYNSYPHSMIWFKDQLYVGTTRANLHLLWFTMGDYVSRFAAWPVQPPANPYDLDLRAQIWRYHPGTQEWTQSLVSPMLMGKEGFEVPLSIGFRGISVFQGKSDPEPALYCTTWASSKGPGPVLLRSFDGLTFEQVSRPGLGDPTVATIRSLVPFQGKLFLSPTGTTKGKYLANIPDRLVILVNEDPARQDWQLACPPFFGDPTNMGIFDMAAFNGHLYAATSNSAEGFQIWKTDARGRPPYKWRRVMTQGGYRGKENQGVGHLFEFKGALYLGTGILGGHDRERGIGPVSPELFRLHPDDTWELIVGEPRLTPQGLKVPLSGLGAGYNSPTVGYFWRMCEHDGWLYLGTYDWTVWMPYVRKDTLPEKLQQTIERVGEENIIKTQAGFDLWRSRNGVDWVPVSRNGFGNPCNFGIRTMASSPHGLFVGAANPFGPTMAIHRLAGWRYEPNPRGGCEIWLGSLDFPEGAAAEPTAEMVPEIGMVRPPKGPLPEIAQQMIADFYQGRGFRQCGFWRYPLKTPEGACENLVQEILALLPENPGRVLDIGCGNGEATQMLIRHLPGATLTGTVAEQEELAACKALAPSGTFHLMPPGKLKFSPETFDAAVAIEGPSTGQAAKKFFKNARRVLKPGGVLVFADLVAAAVKGAPVTLKQYEDLLIRNGFGEIQLWDVTSYTWEPFQAYNKTVFWTKLLAGDITQELYEEIMSRLPGGNQPVRFYLIGRAKKIN